MNFKNYYILILETLAKIIVAQLATAAVMAMFIFLS